MEGASRDRRSVIARYRTANGNRRPGGQRTVGIQFGVFVWVDAGDRPLHRLYDDHLHLAGLADELGFASYHLAEHHCTPLGVAPSPSVFLAAVARATSQMRLGPLVYLLPLYDPFRLAEEVCMLDQLSHGRFELGVGRGVSPWELGHYGVDVAHSREIFTDHLTKLLAALRGDGAAFGRLGGAPVEIEPVQRPYPPLTYATTVPDSVRWAAEQGINLAGLGPAAAWRPNTDLYRSTWEQHRNDPGRLNAHVAQPTISLNRQVVVADTDEEALRIVRAAHPRWADSFTKLWLDNGDETFRHRADLEPALAHRTIIAGSPETVAAAIDAEVETSGVDKIICSFAWGSIPLEAAARSTELFAREVTPRTGRVPA